MNIIEDLKEKLIILEHIIKTVAGCTNCPGCKSLATQYLDNKDCFDNKDPNLKNINIIKSNINQ